MIQEAQRLGIERVPAFVLQGKTNGLVRFFAMPIPEELQLPVADAVLPLRDVIASVHQKRSSRPIRGAMAELSCMRVRSTMLMYVLKRQKSMAIA